MEVLKLLLLSTLLFLESSPLLSATNYNVGDRVPLFVNKVGPLDNPSETYQYYELAFCHPDQVLEKKHNFGEVLNGDRFKNSLYELEFAVNKTESVLCHQKLKRDSVGKFRDAIVSDFYYQMYYDDLPMWAFVGKVDNESWIADSKWPKYFLFTHVQFDAFYNNNRVIEIRAFSDPVHVVDVTEDVEVNIKFTYSVIWNEISSTYENRMDRYWQTALLPIMKQIHWFSFINSIGIFILLLGLLTVLYMRHLKYDLRKWSDGDEEDEKEVGWKYIRGDALRCPKNITLLSAFLGSGAQLLTLVFILFIFALLGVFYPYSRGALLNLGFISYNLLSGVAGFCSVFLCSKFSETGWKQSVLVAGIIFSGPLLVMTFSLNILAAYFGVTAALPLGTMLAILLIYTAVAVPLLVLGGVVGNLYKPETQSLSVAKKIPREIPSLVWYRKTPAQMFLGGLLPFSAIVMELHNSCTTIWGHKIYTLPSILFITFILLIILTALVSIGLTYFQLAVEDNAWFWRSVLHGGSTAIFMFAYCAHFYFKSNMRGVLQASFFFGYTALLCYAFFLMLGTVSFLASFLSVNRIYRTVKRE